MNILRQPELTVVELKDILLRIAARRRSASTASQPEPVQAELTGGGVLARMPVPMSPLSE